MSNSIYTNPVIITTALGSYKAAIASALGSFYEIRIQKIEWYMPVTVGDTYSINDPISNAVIAQGSCEVAAQSQVLDWTPQPRLVADFSVPQISSGTLIVYLK